MRHLLGAWLSASYQNMHMKSVNYVISIINEHVSLKILNMLLCAEVTESFISIAVLFTLYN